MIKQTIKPKTKFQKDVNTCSVQDNECARYNRNSKTNKFTIQGSNEINQSVGIDVTEANDPAQEKLFIILLMVDEFSSLSVATFIPSKDPKDIMNAKNMNWLPNLHPSTRINSLRLGGIV